MSIKYIVRKAKNPQDSEAVVYGGRFKMTERVDFMKLCNLISDQCSVTPSDVKGIISALVNQIKNEVIDSHIVRLGDFGSLRAEVRSNLAVTKEDFGKNNLKGLKMVFTPGSQFKTAAAGARFSALTEVE